MSATPKPQPFKGEFLRSILYSVLRGLLWGWLGRLVAKGYFTSDQAEYLLVGLVSILIVVVTTLYTSLLRYARAAALRRLPADATPKTVNQMTWQIVWKLLRVIPE